MAGIGKQLGPTARRVAANIRRIRRAHWQDITTAELSRRLSELGQPISDTGITKTEAGTRRVDVDDLMAISLALAVTPNKLLLPPVDYIGSPAIHRATPAATKGTAEELWLWAQGERPLTILTEDGRSWLGKGEYPFMEFAVRNRPYLTAVSALGEDDVPGVPDAVLRDVSDAARRALRAGANSSQIRRVIELSMVMPAMLASGRGWQFARDDARPGDEEPPT